jgi:hypothetical protein
MSTDDYLRVHKQEKYDVMLHAVNNFFTLFKYLRIRRSHICVKMSDDLVMQSEWHYVIPRDEM